MTKKKLKGLDHWGWKVACFITAFGAVLIIGVYMTNQLAAYIPPNTPIATCPPGCGMSPWVIQHPFYFLGFLGVIFTVILLVLIVLLFLGVIFTVILLVLIVLFRFQLTRPKAKKP